MLMNTRRVVKIAIGMWASATLWAVLGVTAASAATFTTNTTQWPTPSGSGVFARDQKCSLPEALAAIKRASNAPDCVGSGTVKPDVVTLVAGQRYNIPGTLSITTAVTIRSATANQLATLAQSGRPGPGNLFGGIVEINLNTTNAQVAFQDIDFLGQAGMGGLGLFGQGDDNTNGLTLTRCWVEKFDDAGMYFQNMSLTLIDSAVDGNGASELPLNISGGAIFLESTGGTASTHLTLLNTSITNNLFGGIETELGAASVSTITGSTISDNFGSNALLIAGPHPGNQMNIFGSTIFANSSDLKGQPFSGTQFGALHNTSGGVVTIDQTVIDLNAGPGGSVGDFDFEIDVEGTLNSIKNSFLGEAFSATILAQKGTNIIFDVSNLQRALADNGGVGQRHPRTHKPAHGSKLIDFTSAIDTPVGTQDQRHKNRGFDFVSGGNKFDIGAVELQSGE